MKTNNYDLVITIVNRGYSEMVMDVARENGATGGTILHGHGTGNSELQQVYNIVPHEEKEVILIVAKKDKRTAIMDAVMRVANLGTAAQGITFSLPVEDFLVLSRIFPDENLDLDNN